MNPAATKLIADRGDGLTPKQRRTLAAIVAGDEVKRVPGPVRRASSNRGVDYGGDLLLGKSVSRTVAVLARYGLVELDGRHWRLTDDGRCLALRMGMTQPGPVRDSPGDMYDSHELEPRDLAELARRADELLAMENAGITDSWREDA